MSGHIPHGSPQGYALGCRSRGGCQHHGSQRFLTCVEASIARRREHTFAALPADQPLPRGATAVPVLPESDPRRVRRDPLHGTTFGYARGCRDAHACPHWRAGRVTCAEARRRYVSEYQRRRRAGAGTPIPHGTVNGYLSGCRARECPGDASGITCAQARAEYRRGRRRSQGVEPVREKVGAAPAGEILERLRGRGMSVRAMAVRLGIGRTTIARILRACEQGGAARLLIDIDTEQKIRKGEYDDGLSLPR